MNAMLLCAGRGVRMQPLTRSLPKPALPVLGRPLALHNLVRLRRAGVRRVAVNMHHLPEILPAILGEGGRDGLPEIRYTVEDPVLGTAGGLRHAAEHLRGGGPFLVHNGDFLSDIDVAAAVEAHRRSGCAATLVLTGPREDYSVVEVNDRGRVVSIAGRPSLGSRRAAGCFLFTGMQVLDEAVLDLVPAGRPSDIVPDVLLGLVADGRVGAYVHRGFWWEFGNLRAFLDGSLRLIELPVERLRAIASPDPVRSVGEARVAVGPGADFHNAVELRGRCALGHGCRIAEGSTIEDCVILPEAWIGPGCALARVIVGPETEVPAGFEIEGAVLCPDPGDDADEDLSPDTERRDGLLVRRL